MRFGIFTAMEEEAQSFLQSRNAKKFRVGEFDFFEFELGNHSAVLCCPPSVGEIAAASACQLLITLCKVDAILNFGVVGALTEKLALCSTVLVKSVVHYGMDTSEADERPQGWYDCFGGTVVECDKTLLQEAAALENMPEVVCASADIFVAEPSKKTALNEKFGAEICDMESAGILFTCKFNNVPCLMVKSVSDSLAGGAGEYFDNVKKAAAEFFDFAKKLADKLE